MDIRKYEYDSHPLSMYYIRKNNRSYYIFEYHQRKAECAGPFMANESTGSIPDKSINKEDVPKPVLDEFERCEE